MIGYVDISHATVMQARLKTVQFRFDQFTLLRMKNSFLRWSMGCRIKERTLVLWIPKTELRFFHSQNGSTCFVKMQWVSQNNVWSIVKSGDPAQTDPTTAFNSGVTAWQCGYPRNLNRYKSGTVARHDWLEGWDTAWCFDVLGSYS